MPCSNCLIPIIFKSTSKSDSIDAINRVLQKQELEKQIVNILSDEEVQEIISVGKSDSAKSKPRKRKISNNPALVINIETSDEDDVPIRSLSNQNQEMGLPTKLLNVRGLNKSITEEDIRYRIRLLQEINCQVQGYVCLIVDHTTL